jgi:pimeloyl-ACP methyl ester carboxylesterase
LELFEAEAALPYLLDQVEGADQILVGFPAYRTGVVPPGTWQLAQIARYTAHRLLLGADEHTYIGPAQELRGLRTAVRLIEKTTDELGVAPERVVCFGTSMAATLAALTGLAYGARAIVLGAPPLAIGTLVGAWSNAELRTTDKPMTSARHLLELGRRDSGPDPIEWGDGLIPSFAAACPRPAKVRLFTNPKDFTFPGVKQFYDERASFPNVKVELELTGAPSHDAVAKAFYADFLPRVLSEELGTPSA